VWKEKNPPGPDLKELLDIKAKIVTGVASNRRGIEGQLKTQAKGKHWEKVQRGDEKKKKEKVPQMTNRCLPEKWRWKTDQKYWGGDERGHYKSEYHQQYNTGKNRTNRDRQKEVKKEWELSKRCDHSRGVEEGDQPRRKSG